MSAVTTSTTPKAGVPSVKPAGSPRPRRPRLRTPLSVHGEPMVWLTGGALACCLAMIISLLVLILWQGAATFWPAPLVQITTHDGAVMMGEITRSERYRPEDRDLEALPEAARAAAQVALEALDGVAVRHLVRTGNYELTQQHFRWVSELEIASRERPEWALLLERFEWGHFYGFPQRYLVDGEPVAELPGAVWDAFREDHPEVRRRAERREELETRDLGRTFRQREAARLAVREIEIEHGIAPAWARAFREWHAAPGEHELRVRLERLERGAGRPPEEAVNAYRGALDAYAAAVEQTERDNAGILDQIRRLDADNARFAIVVRTATGQEQTIALDDVVRAAPVNQLSIGQRIGLYLARWWEFLSEEPRQANSAGGVFPAIVGTVLMTLIMALLVVPFGVLAALYLREYARGGAIVSVVRIAINNLAGVPSIVFGVFGLGFFCYGVGGYIDGGPAWAMPKPGWFVLLTAVVIIAAAAFAATALSFTRPGRPRSRARRALRTGGGALWIVASLAALVLIATTPFFDGFYRAALPNPTFGKGALIWASFTLALLTLPVVIVATEEALAAVPNSLREGSYACGAGKWQTIRRILLPRAMPGIMTGAILAMARGAGEVAPLMLVGAVKLAPHLPVSWRPADHFGLDRSFMHLGYHIFDLGFHSQNSEAAKPLVFTTTLLLIALIALLNVTAIGLRSRLRRRFAGAQW